MYNNKSLDLNEAPEKLAEMTEELRQFGERLERGRLEAEKMKSENPEKYAEEAVDVTENVEIAEEKLAALKNAADILAQAVPVHTGPNRKERRRKEAQERRRKAKLARMNNKRKTKMRKNK